MKKRAPNYRIFKQSIICLLFLFTISCADFDAIINPPQGAILALGAAEKRAVVVRLGHKRGENRTSQHYLDDIDDWLGAALDILNQKENITH